MYIETLSKTRYMQYLATISATLSLACYGMYACWASPILPKLTSANSPIGITLTNSEASWVASSFQLGHIPGGVLAGCIVAKFGPKQSILISMVPLFCPWILLVFARSSWELVIARFIAGVGGAIATTAVPIYNAEVPDKDIRGKLGSTSSLLTIVGNLFILAVGPFLSYTSLNVICSIFCVLFGIIFVFMPESPYYLVKSNQISIASSTISKLCAQDTSEEHLQQCLDEITNTVNQDMNNKSTFWELLSNSAYRIPLTIMIGLKVIQQFCGMSAVDSYLQTIIESSNSSISPELSSIILGLFQLFAVLLAGALVDKVGRKPLLIVSSLGSGCALIIEGLYFYYFNSDSSTFVIEKLGWVPTTGLILFQVMNPIGLGSLPYVLIGEIFPTNIKSHAVSLNSFLRGILGFVAVASFEPISRIAGMYATFWVFAVVAFLGAVFIYLILPETKQKTFIEIQSKFNKNKPIELICT